jgi:hypothetical protein
VCTDDLLIEDEFMSRMCDAPKALAQAQVAEKRTRLALNNGEQKVRRLDRLLNVGARTGAGPTQRCCGTQTRPGTYANVSVWSVEKM